MTVLHLAQILISVVVFEHLAQKATLMALPSLGRSGSTDDQHQGMITKESAKDAYAVRTCLTRELSKLIICGVEVRAVSKRYPSSVNAGSRPSNGIYLLRLRPHGHLTHQ